MAFYTGIECPVCKEKFKDGEDVITCPVCGTPSHRTCYEKKGACVNASKHKDGFSYDVKEVKKEVAKEIDNEATKENPGVSPVVERTTDEKTQCPNCQQRNVKAPVPKVGFKPSYGVDEAERYSHSEDTIGGEKTYNIACVVKKKADTYIDKFNKLEHKKGKMSWNWAAAIFGPYWYFYRKISKNGYAFLGIEIIITTLINIIFSPQLSAYSKVVTDVATKIGNSEGTIISQEHTQTLMDAMTANNIIPIFAIMIGCIAISRIVGGIFANHFYKNYCLNVVKRGKSNLENPEFATRIASMGYQIKSKTELVKYYLGQFGGTSVLGIISCYLANQVVLMLIGMFI